jgi:hypothetical protein
MKEFIDLVLSKLTGDLLSKNLPLVLDLYESARSGQFSDAAMLEIQGRLDAAAHGRSVL